MAAILPVAGARVSIGGVTVAVPTATTYAAETWTLVDGVKNVGSFGDQIALITSDQVNSSRTKKAKGTANAGTLELSCDRVPADPGQVKLDTAAAANSRYSIKIELPSTGVNKFDIVYLTGYVMSGRYNATTPNTPQERAFTIELDEAPIYVAAV